ncbi:MAG: histidine kinase [Bacteroidetes bacterium]|nr:histidine kinase [Bacteroidota bacterium]MCB0844821.1 histidine kinase [Bacteroidota bacterium]
MREKFHFNSPAFRETIFQLILHILVFLFYSFDRYQPRINEQQVAFFFNYAMAAFLINYIFLPQFYYQKKYIPFLLFLILTIGGVIAIEEIILEPLYFPNTRRALYFPGVFVSLIDVLPVISILSGFKFAWDALGKQRELDQLKASVTESEIQFLTSQINPHFLFNNLNNLYSYAIENSPKTPTIILELSSVLRYMLYECREKYVPLMKEIEQLENFTQLYELQIEERGVVNFHTHNIQSGYKIAPLILIVFIENAFKHSQASQSENIMIDIHIQLSNQGKLDFYCINNFQKLANTENLSKGIGLKNVKKRLELIYPGAYQLEIEENETQYSVHLSLQLTRTDEA